MKQIKLLISLLVLILLVTSCSKLKDLKNLTAGDRLYFCEKYDAAKDKCEGESSKYTTGTLTVMAKLSKAIDVSDVDINITDLKTKEVVETKPFTVPKTDYIYFEGVNFDKPGNYKVSLLKKDGTVIVSNEIEIVSK